MPNGMLASAKWPAPSDTAFWLVCDTRFSRFTVAPGTGAGSTVKGPGTSTSSSSDTDMGGGMYGY